MNMNITRDRNYDEEKECFIRLAFIVEFLRGTINYHVVTCAFEVVCSGVALRNDNRSLTRHATSFDVAWRVQDASGTDFESP